MRHAIDKLQRETPMLFCPGMMPKPGVVNVATSRFIARMLLSLAADATALERHSEANYLFGTALGIIWSDLQ